MARKRTRINLRQFALTGARTRLQEVMSEAREIVAAFPELAREVGIVATRTARGAVKGARKAARRGRRRMSAAQRKEVSARMKKYWASRRKTKIAKSA